MRQRTQHVGVLLLVLGVIIVGCAKRPQTAQVAAPGPIGVAAAQPPSTAPAPAPADPGAPAVSPPSAPPAAPATPARVAPPVEGFRPVPALRDIHFDFDKSDIRPDAARTLDGNAEWIRANPEALILIEGHCDERGTNEYNLALGERRARATLNYLITRGVAADRLTTISYGEERPLCADRTEACWAKNRRAHFLARIR